MKLLTCASVRRRLTAFHDGELPVEEYFAVEAHIEGCPPCAKEVAALDDLRNLLRSTYISTAARSDLRGCRADILSRAKQAYDATWPARLERFWDDVHLVWIGMAAAAASLVCGVLMAGMLQYASPERNDSLAAMIQALASRDPFMQLPSPGDVVPAALMDSMTEDEAVLALSAMVTREGRVNGLELISSERDQQHMEELLDAVSRARFQPAQQGGSPVRANMVWLLAHTTVRGKRHL
jgi:anti-sigma factor RsiW